MINGSNDALIPLVEKLIKEESERNGGVINIDNIISQIEDVFVFDPIEALMIELEKLSQCYARETAGPRTLYDIGDNGELITIELDTSVIRDEIILESLEKTRKEMLRIKKKAEAALKNLSKDEGQLTIDEIMKN